MFIDEWFDKSFYRDLPATYRDSYLFGQLFWTHAYYPHENLELWRPVPSPSEPTKTIAREFQLQAAGKDAFRRAYPLQTPKLETNEEFIAVRAKRRPVILMQAASSLDESDNKGFRGRLQRRRCLVAQVYGLSDVVTERVEFNPVLIDRVRKMEFPELMFLPKRSGFLEVDSMLRLDEMQSVFRPHLEPKPLALSGDLCEILRHQFQFLITRSAPNPYTELREVLLKD